MEALTQANIDELDALLMADNRGQFYWRYYEMSGEYQALVQAQITTYSGVWGGLAVIGNYLAKLQDQENGRKGDAFILRLKGVNHAKEGEGFGAKLSTPCRAAWA